MECCLLVHTCDLTNFVSCTRHQMRGSSHQSHFYQPVLRCVCTWFQNFFLNHKGHVYINFTNISEHSSFYEHPRCRQVSVWWTSSAFFIPLSPAFVLPCLQAVLKGCCCKSVTEPPPAVHAKWWGEAVRPCLYLLAALSLSHPFSDLLVSPQHFCAVSLMCFSQLGASPVFPLAPGL